MVRRRMAVIALVASLGGAGATAGPAAAGGSRLTPVRDRYEPGQAATLVGYTGGPMLAAVPEDTFYAYLRPADEAVSARLLRSDRYVGELVIEDTGQRGYLQFRVSVTFDVPDDLDAGAYDLVYCDDPCSGRFLGDIIGGTLSVGVDPVRRVVREWTLNDPEIARLAPDALLVGPDYQATAAEVRAGRPLRPPAALDPPPTTVAPAAPPPTAAAAVTTPVPETAEHMAWPLPTALVLASAAATALLLSRRRSAAPTPRAGMLLSTGDRSRRDPASAGRG